MIQGVLTFTCPRTEIFKRHSGCKNAFLWGTIACLSNEGFNFFINFSNILTCEFNNSVIWMTSQDTLTSKRAVLDHIWYSYIVSFFFFLIVSYAKKTPTYYMNQARTASRIHPQLFIALNTMLFRPYCCFYEDVFSQNWAISFEQVFQCKCVPSGNADNEKPSSFMCCIW